jgi:hypothetical protein
MREWLIRRVNSILRLRSDFDMDITSFAQERSAVSSDEKGQSDLSRAFYENDGLVVHKWTHYLPIYDRHLSRYRKRPLRLLEIGVSAGGSLHLWREYFGDDAVIYGIDIDPGCSQFNGQDGQVRIGSQSDPTFLRAVVSEMGGVDVVIDDGSHIASHQRITLDALFPLLNPDGVYICEDLHTAYWPTYEGAYGKSSNFIEVGKRIVDDIHTDFHSRKARIIADAARTVDGVHFYNSMVVIEKRPCGRPAHVMSG